MRQVERELDSISRGARRPGVERDLQKHMENPVIGVGSFIASPRAKALVRDALDRNRLTYGPFMERFESGFAKLHDCRFGVMTNSGTSALHVALAVMKEMYGWEDGDEIIVPAVTFVATSNIILHNRMRPVFVDVDPLYYELNADLIPEKITPKTRAIIPVHLFGQPCEMDAIEAVAARNHLRIIEDSCETMFARYKGRSAGSLGDMGCFSTYVAHLLVTGVGGLVTTNNPEYAIRLRSLINHGRDSIYLSIDDDDKKEPDELRMIVARRFSFISLGHSFRATELEAALGLAQLEEWAPMIQKRRENARFLSRALSPFEDRIQLPTIRPECDHSFMMFPIVMRQEPKEDLVNYLEQHGVETRDMLPLINQPLYKRLLGADEEGYPTAKWINQNGFYIGCHQDLKETDLEYVVEIFERFFRNRSSRVREGAVLILSTGNSSSALRQFMEFLPLEMFDEVIALDEDSSDGTAEILETQGIKVLAARGLDVFTFIKKNQIGPDYQNIVFFEVDGQQDPRDVARLLLKLERGHDMVIASRFIQGGKRYDRDRRIPYRSLGNRLFSLAANLLFYGNFSDTLNRLRACKRDRLEKLSLDEQGLAGVYQMSIQAMKQGWRVGEIPTVEQMIFCTGHRRKVLGSIWPLLRVLIKEWFREWRRPRKEIKGL